MTLALILASVAAATIVNATLLGLAWRATQTERRTGSAPWYLGAGIAVYGLAGAGFVYAYRGQSITTALEAFAVSAVAEVFGAVVIFGVFQAIYREDAQPTGQRVFEIGASLFLLAVVLAGLFA